MTSQFPWDKLRAETLRTLCKELGFPAKLSRRDEMIKALAAVQEHGLEETLERFDELVPEGEAPAAAGTTTTAFQRPKRPRKSDAEVTMSRNVRKKGMELRSGLRADGGQLKKRRNTFDGVVIESKKPDATAPPVTTRRRAAPPRKRRRTATKAKESRAIEDEEDEVDAQPADENEEGAEGAGQASDAQVPVSFAALADNDADGESEGGADRDRVLPIANSYVVNEVVITEVNGSNSHSEARGDRSQTDKHLYFDRDGPREVESPWSRKRQRHDDYPRIFKYEDGSGHEDFSRDAKREKTDGDDRSETGVHELRIKGASRRMENDEDEILPRHQQDAASARDDANRETQSRSKHGSGLVRRPSVMKLWTAVSDHLGHLWPQAPQEGPPEAPGPSAEEQEAGESSFTYQEELVLVRAELGEATRTAAEYRLKEEESQRHLAEARAMLQRAEQEKVAALESREEIYETARKQEADCHKLQQEKARLQATLASKDRQLKDVERSYDSRIQGLLEEKGNLKRELKAQRAKSQPRGQASSVRSTTPVDFESGPDQVSEMFLKSQAPFSVESINTAVDDLVINIMEKAGELSAAFAGDTAAAGLAEMHAPDSTPKSAGALENALQPRYEVDQEGRELLLDALLHHEVLSDIHHVFFSINTSTVNFQGASLLDDLERRLGKKESWKTVQKWRSLTAVCTEDLIDPTMSEEVGRNMGERVIEQVALAYRVPAQVLDSMREDIFSGLSTTYKMARELSLVMKRDVLAVRLMVGAVSEGTFDHRAVDSQWPEMGVKEGDRIVGAYGLGLSKLSADGRLQSLTRPKVVTEALFRQLSPA
ncbi:hypothetical protein GLOTRDRAFT_122482 [Gloeophyllum trabeum ATCC 11539]|uniref:SAP domain-containing protein n=1 Tax=Gloeophyllum trabeum (strain ATCC 11539 / FP-39264 / Madison 617) TaxID=670483 RepID=S7Q050_GLOTA|nr:uncharacterized protein GLOTRDRAFT_122482 [Gloeophyllum trabeum ATCC 11539]EPQ53306.1 hypothetical protein GLOTRDRAFT_122482 [Gloeophyllum trabeum ATCC 11539]